MYLSKLCWWYLKRLFYSFLIPNPYIPFEVEGQVSPLHFLINVWYMCKYKIIVDYLVTYLFLHSQLISRRGTNLFMFVGLSNTHLNAWQLIGSKYRLTSEKEGVVYV